MAVIGNKKNNSLSLEIDNGDLQKLDEVINKWKFVDYQSFMRFTVSIMLKTERNILYIDVNNHPQGIIPADHLIKKEIQNAGGSNDK
jgi:hypothetical protein